MLVFRSATKVLFAGMIGGLCGVFPSFAAPIKLDYTTPLTVNGWTKAGSHIPSVPYQVGTDPWVVNLSPDPPKYLPPGATSATDSNAADAEALLSKLMTDQMPKWAPLTESTTTLSDDSLIVHLYEAVHAAAGESAICDYLACVGANFGVEYKPGKDDPTDVHWIQIITADGKSSIDNGLSRQGLPYYDDGGTADKTGFLDYPRRGDATKHTWIADLFLVTGPAIPTGDHGPAPGPINVLGGIQWGWENHCTKANKQSPSEASSADACDCNCNDSSPTPEPASFLMTLVGFVPLVLFAQTFRRRQG
jgi:hypothetical protein